MAPMAALSEMSESRSVGKRPLGAVCETPGRSGTPQFRQTCAHAGFACPQLKHSTVSPVIAGWSSCEALWAAADGENADGRLADPATGRPPAILADGAGRMSPSADWRVSAGTIG
jgi:hypothetical protein